MALSVPQAELIPMPEGEQDAALWIENVAARVPPCDQEMVAPGLIQTARAIEAVKSNDDAALAVSYSRDLAVCKKEIEAHYEPYTGTAFKLHKRMVALRAGAVARIGEEITRLDGLAVGWNRFERARIQEEERQQRLKVEADARAEKKRIEDEAQAKADELAAAGKAEEADAIIEQAALDVADVRPAPILMPVAGPSAKSAIASVGGSLSTYHKWELTDLMLLVKAATENPAAYLPLLCVNEKTVNAMVKAQGMMFRAPGIVVTEDERLSKRGKQ